MLGNSKIGVPMTLESIESVTVTFLVTTVPNVMKPDRNIEAMNAKERIARRGFHFNP